ncbi:MAG: hypothetical protein FJX25_00680 [Alphaproteobacteria bacterium]|nr:hypothetical protein [Alphaproteobacteria bacterium]
MIDRLVSTLTTLLVMSAPASAWQHTTDFRGLEIYDYEADGIDMQVICDPKGAFIPPIYSARIEFGEDDYEGEVTLQSGEASFIFQMRYGSVLPSDAASWTSLIEGLRSGSELTLTAGDQTLQLDTVSPFPVTCGAKI